LELSEEEGEEEEPALSDWTCLELAVVVACVLEVGVCSEDSEFDVKVEWLEEGETLGGGEEDFGEGELFSAWEDSEGDGELS